MTRITFYKKNGKILGFDVVGHTGKAPYGSDLLCEQISTVAQMPIAVIGEMAGAECEYKISDGSLSFRLGEAEIESEKYQFLLEGCLYSFKSIVCNEKKYAKLEVKNV